MSLGLHIIYLLLINHYEKGNITRRKRLRDTKGKRIIKIKRRKCKGRRGTGRTEKGIDQEKEEGGERRRKGKEKRKEREVGERVDVK